MGTREEIIAWSICWEGSISLLPSRGYAVQPRIAVYNTDKKLIDQFKELVGYGFIYTIDRTKSRATTVIGKPCTVGKSIA